MELDRKSVGRSATDRNFAEKDRSAVGRNADRNKRRKDFFLRTEDISLATLFVLPQIDRFFQNQAVCCLTLQTASLEHASPHGHSALAFYNNPDAEEFRIQDIPRYHLEVEKAHHIQDKKDVRNDS